MKTLWYKFWCRIFGSILLIRLGVVLQDTIFSKYDIEYSTKKKKIKLRMKSERNRPKKTEAKKTKKNPIRFTNEGIKG